MALPTIRRDGDTWSLTWDAHNVGMGMERIQETRDGVRALVTVESMIDGRVLGPAYLNMLSSTSQATFANACAERVNGLDKAVWRALVVQACGIVYKQYSAPTPTIDLSTVEDSGPLQYLVPGWIPEEETTVVYGDGESAKSLLSLVIAFCVATGHELPWGARPKQGEVLYLDWETNVRTVARRLRRIALGELAATPKIHYRQCFRSLADELPSIREEISKKKIALVIVDSIGFAASGSLNEDETARAVMNAMRQMHPATRLGVAHVSKESALSSGAVKPFGSAFFWNGMRSGIEVRRSEDQPNRDAIDLALFHRKANDDEHTMPLGLRVLFDGRDKGILFTQGNLEEAPDLAARTSLSARIRRMLRDGAKTTAQMAEDLEVKESTVRTTVGRMGDVIRLNEGEGRGHVALYGLEV